MKSSNSHLRRHLFSALAAMTALLCHACTSDVAFSQYVQLPEDVWNKDSLAIFRADINDTIGVYDVWINTRNDNDYPFSNVWLFIDVFSPDGHHRRDTLDCTLAYPDGTWVGGGWGSLFSTRTPYMSAVRFPRSGPYTFRVSQGMRSDDLQGLHDIGILIQKHKEN